MSWIILKKGGVPVHIAYNKDFSNNLFVYNTQICIKPEFTIKFDFNPNIKTRNKAVNSYLDACDLAEGGIKELTLIQIDDNTILKRISEILNRENSISNTWSLIVELEGKHSFKVTPEFKRTGSYLTLFLRVK